MKIPRQEYAAEFKELAVTQVNDGLTAGAAASGQGGGDGRTNLRNWGKAASAWTLNGTGVKVVTPEQMELSRLRTENVRLKRANEILKKRRRTSQGTRCEVRLDEGAAHGLYSGRDVCVLAVSESGYRAWRQGGTPDHTRLTDAQLLALIPAIHDELKGAHGSPRMVKELRGRGVLVSKPRVERLMRDHGIWARHKRRDKVTTDSRPACQWRQTGVKGDFTPSAPNQTWTSDITYSVDR